MRLSAWLDIAGLVSLMLAGSLVYFARLNDPAEPLIQRDLGKWKHMRVGFPFAVLAVILLVLSGVLKLVR